MDEKRLATRHPAFGASAMKPLLLKSFTATSCIGKGVTATLEALQQQRSGLAICDFETVDIDTHIGEVAGVDDAGCRTICGSSTAATTGWRSWPCSRTVFSTRCSAPAQRWGRQRMGVFLGTSTAGILQTELAYRQRDPVERRPAGDLRLRPHPELLSPSRTTCVSAAARRGPPCGLLGVRLQRQGVRLGAAHDRGGLIDAALVGGVDSLCLTTLYGFHSLQLTSAVPAARSTRPATGSRSARPRHLRCWSAYPTAGRRCRAAARHRRIQRRLPHVGAASRGSRRAARDAGCARGRGARRPATSTTSTCMAPARPATIGRKAGLSPACSVQPRRAAPPRAPPATLSARQGRWRRSSAPSPSVMD